MKEIGGYFECEQNRGKEYYDYLAFNSSRDSLKFVIEKRNIKKIYLPHYICKVVKDLLEKKECEIIYYNLNDKFEPIIEGYDNESYIYIVNLFGMLRKKTIKKYIRKYRKIILDNTHDFFMRGFDNIDIIYNCRKFFGVPDGSYLYTNLRLDEKKYEQATSLSKLKHVYGRYESSASEYYSDFCKEEETFKDDSIKLMSKITHNMLRGINYNNVLKNRKNNFFYLNRKIKINKLKQYKTTFMYPLLLENGDVIRKKLLDNKIYIPILWNEIEKEKLNEFERYIQKNLILIPIDQRYDKNDMKYIFNLIKEEI